MEVRLSLQPKQKEALQLSEATPVLFYGGAKGGGKSHLVRAREAWRRLKYPGTKGLIVRKTFPELLSNHIRPFFKEYPMVREWYNKAEKTLYWPNGSITEFSYLNNTDDVYTYQGREYEDVTIDEITQHEEEVFKILRTSVRTTNPDIYPTMFFTGNPGGIGHGWVKRIFIDRQFKSGESPEDFAFVQAKVWDNQILLNADPDYIKRLESLPEQVRKAYLEGDWDVFSGQVFTEWRRELHVVEPFEIPREWNRYIAMDWGTNKPFSVGWYAQDTDGRSYKYREMYMNGDDFFSKYGKPLTPKRLARLVKGVITKRSENIKYMVCDPSIWKNADFGKQAKDFNEGESVAETMIRQGLTLIKADNDRMNGLNRLRECLAPAADGKPLIQFFSTCYHTIRTLPSLVYDKYKVEDVDSDGEDHAYDETRYYLMSRPVKTTPQQTGEVSLIKQAMQNARNTRQQAYNEWFS